MIKFEPNPVEIIPVPKEIDLDWLTIEANKCQTNAYRVCRAFPEFTYVEGVITTLNENGEGEIFAHAWNKNKAGHFDVTASIWLSEGHQKIKKIIYYPVFGYESSELKPAGQFSPETMALVDVRKMTQDWKFKPDDQVVLFDRISGKPVNHGVINNYDVDKKEYHVKIDRLGNEFLYGWPEDLIEISTPELVEKADDFLNDLELKSAHILIGQQLDNQPLDKVLEIPLSTHDFIIYYIQMKIDGATKWRLLTVTGFGK